MNYEELYRNLLPLEKKMKDSITAVQKLHKSMGKDTEAGDLKNLSRNLLAASEALKEQAAIVEQLQNQVESFDSKEYYESGEFVTQMLDFCKEKDVDVTGEYPVFEMFPYKVRLDAENQDVYLDRKRFSCVRPLSFVQMVKAGRDRLMKVPFNSQMFLNELADAYDLAILKLGKREESDIYLTSLYKFLAPMSRFRKDYDQQSFAFDLARLYASGEEITKNGRRIQFGPNRFANKAIRILDEEGNEQFLATVRFFSDN